MKIEKHENKSNHIVIFTSLCFNDITTLVFTCYSDIKHINKIEMGFLKNIETHGYMQGLHL
jgi:hypothetical protein